MTANDILSVLDARLPSLAAIYLFGSRARGDARADSDLDLAMLGARPLSPEILAETRETLEAKLGCDVDLVDLATASTMLAREILTDGRRLAAPDPVNADLFEVRTLRDYDDLKRRRQGIEADIVQRGRVLAA
jgi:uncharacterized protein